MKLFIKGSGGLDLTMVRITAPRQATVYHKVVEQIACECVNTDGAGRGRGDSSCCEVSKGRSGECGSSVRGVCAQMHLFWIRLADRRGVLGACQKQ